MTKKSQDKDDKPVVLNDEDLDQVQGGGDAGGKGSGFNIGMPPKGIRGTKTSGFNIGMPPKRR